MVTYHTCVDVRNTTHNITDLMNRGKGKEGCVCGGPEQGVCAWRGAGCVCGGEQGVCVEGPSRVCVWREHGVCGGEQGVRGGEQGVRGGEQGVCGGEQGVRGGEQGVCGGEQGVCGGREAGCVRGIGYVWREGSRVCVWRGAGRLNVCVWEKTHH